MIKKIFAVVTFCAGAVSAASASVVFDNGGPMGGGTANNAVFWTQSNDFTLATTTSITGGSVYLEAQGGLFSAWDGTLNYYFFADNAGSPGAAALASGVATNLVDTATTITDQAGTGKIQRIDFGLVNAFDATAGTTYWLGIQLGKTGTIGWSAAFTGAGANQMESFGSTYNNWTNNGRDGAFLLNGGATVPEPGSLALVGLSLLAAAAVRRRR